MTKALTCENFTRKLGKLGDIYQKNSVKRTKKVMRFNNNRCVIFGRDAIRIFQRVKLVR